MDDEIHFSLDTVYFSGPARKIYAAISEYWKLKSISIDTKVSLIDIYIIHYPKAFLANTIKALNAHNPLAYLCVRDPKICFDIETQKGYAIVSYDIYNDGPSQELHSL